MASHGLGRQENEVTSLGKPRTFASQKMSPKRNGRKSWPATGSLEPTRKGLDTTDWEQLSVAVEEAFRGALRELGSQRRFTAKNYKGREAVAVPDCSHHRPSPQGVPKVRTTRLRRLGRRLEQWYKHPDPQLPRHVLREAFFGCP